LLGHKIISLTDVAIGDIVLIDSIEFDAHNLAKITHVNNTLGFFYAYFVSPSKIRKTIDEAKHSSFYVLANQINTKKEKQYKISVIDYFLPASSA
jgi:putative NADH-flavin reductase